MDFFQAQDRARKRTRYLVFLFILAVAGTIVAGYAATMFAVNHSRNRGYDDYYRAQVVYWDARILGAVALITLAIVGSASLYKWSQMRAGGSAVAEMLNGRPVDPQTTDLQERRLLNVVEEMAIASGVPVPAVYIMENEPGLNAFAAGLTTSDAVVAVTRGTLDKLDRDELQGVIAHEFSHILNGDMRMNLKLTAIVFGILVIGLIGRGILFSKRRTRVRRSSKKGGGGIAIGLAFLIVGYVGYFFGRLIQAAVSRQREFLADASAVQFTRNPIGVSGALKKIGGYALGSTMLDRHAGEIGHFFFAQAFRSNFGGLWATHPPLGERIKAVDPQWDGKLYEPETVVDVATESFATAGFAGAVRHSPAETLARVHGATATIPPPAPRVRIPFTPATVVAEIGALTASHFSQAQSLLENLPTRLRDAAHDATQAPALVFGLLLGTDPEHREKAAQLVEQHAGTDAAGKLAHLRPALSILDPAARLPLLQLALPTLRNLDAGTLDRFVTTLDELVHADNEVSAFEFALQKVLIHHLKLGNSPSQRVQFHSFRPLAPDISVSLSYLASAGTTLAEDDQGVTAPVDAFNAARRMLPLIADELDYIGTVDLAKVDAALDRLALATPPIKQRVLQAAAQIVGADGMVSIEEGELYRAFAAALDVPVPILK